MAALLPPENCFVRIGTKREAELHTSSGATARHCKMAFANGTKGERASVGSNCAECFDQYYPSQYPRLHKSSGVEGVRQQLVSIATQDAYQSRLEYAEAAKLRELSRAGFAAEGYGRRSVRKEP